VPSNLAETMRLKRPKRNRTGSLGTAPTGPAPCQVTTKPQGFGTEFAMPSLVPEHRSAATSGGAAG
jgi:hypothetical protein